MRRVAVLIPVLTLVTGCVAAWTRADLNVPQPIGGGQQIEIWRGGSAVRWRVVDVTRDSIIGVPVDRPEQCDSCRRSVARAAVDSVRWGYPTSSVVKTVGLTVLAASSIIVTIGFIDALGRD